jgi:methylenetetrahydrofolate dehydrogenase (NADP+)/methenyltetrahydrofolate cyclohydrolase
MPAVIMDGTALAKLVREQVAGDLAGAGNPAVCLATVLVGDDGPSRRYVASKQKQAAQVGLLSEHHELAATATQAEVEALVGTLAADPAVHAILVQLPLPAGLDTNAVIDLIPPDKDVDGLTARSLGRLVRGEPGLVPCTPRGVMLLLDHYGVELSGRRAVVLGRSTLVGLPVALLLAAKGTDATVTIAHSRTPDLPGLLREADVIVSAVGVARIVGAESVKPGAAVVDVGISRTEAGIAGDCDFDAVAAVAGWVTPMPGGTGPMTVACLLENTLAAARLQGVVGR